MSVFFCPHCEHPLVGKGKVARTPGQLAAAVSCSHCKAILRIEILTLKDPDKNFSKNQPPKATTFCKDCGTEILIGNNHACTAKELATVPTVFGEVKEEKLHVCPHGKAVTDSK